tara:strand:- start:78 stop:386 length:309 start_codon:yes stop_codon:yes gene_type:complete
LILLQTVGKAVSCLQLTGNPIHGLRIWSESIEAIDTATAASWVNRIVTILKPRAWANRVLVRDHRPEVESPTYKSHETFQKLDRRSKNELKNALFVMIICMD